MIHINYQDMHGKEREIENLLGLNIHYQICFFFRYMISGSLCDIIQFIIDYILHNQINIIVSIFNDSSVCWMVSFTACVIFRHTSHRYLVFGINLVSG